MTSPSYCITAHANEIPAQTGGLTGAPYTTQDHHRDRPEESGVTLD